MERDGTREVRTIKLTVAYDGTDFLGWQVQPGKRTVQGILEEALKKLTGEKVRVVGSGRTDAGVHAEGQVAHFCTKSGKKSEVFTRALNALLSEDVAVLSAEDAGQGFHARYDARRKLYRYTVWIGSVRSPFWRRTAFYYPFGLRCELMQEAASLLVGRRDFASFASNRGRPEKSTVREIFRLDVVQKENFLFFLTEGDGFLYKMVRGLVGTLLDVGRGENRS